MRADCREQPVMHYLLATLLSSEFARRYVAPTLASSAVAYGITLTQLDATFKVVASATFAIAGIVGVIAAIRRLYKDWNK